MLGLDMLVCGSCNTNFPLASILAFMQHKKFDCDITVNNLGDAQKILFCQSCPEKFITPWSLLQHAQNVHALSIYLESRQCCVNNGRGCEEMTMSNLLPVNLFSSRGAVILQQAQLKTNSQITGVPVQVPGSNRPVVLAVSDVPVTIAGISGKNRVIQNLAEVNKNHNNNSTVYVAQRDANPAQTASRTKDAVAGMLALHMSKPDANIIQESSTSINGGTAVLQNYGLTNASKQIQTSENQQVMRQSASASTIDIAKTISSDEKESAKPAAAAAAVVCKVVTTETAQQTTEESMTTTKRCSVSPGEVCSTDNNKAANNDSVNKDSADNKIKDSADNKIKDSADNKIKDSADNKIKDSADTNNKVTCDVGIQTVRERPLVRKGSSSKLFSKKKQDGCCDRQECGITVMPLTHKKLEKCCVSVVPKKRKRHMETKHMFSSYKSSKKSMHTSSSSESAIYIDVETSMDEHDENETYSKQSSSKKKKVPTATLR